MRQIAYFWILCLSVCSPLFGQEDTAAKAPSEGFSDKLRTIINKEALKAKEEYQERKVINDQKELFGRLRKNYSEVAEYVRLGVDTAAIEERLSDVAQKAKVAADGIFTNKGTIQTARNLATSSILYQELLARTVDDRQEIEKQYKTILGWRNRIDSMALDTAMYYIPKDSVGAREFLEELLILSREHGDTDTRISAELKKLRALTNRVALQEISLRARIADIEGYRVQLSNNTFKRELAPIWDSVGYTRSFREIMHYSWKKTIYVGEYYISNHTSYLVSLLLLILAFSKFFKLLYTRAQAYEQADRSVVFAMLARHPRTAGVFLALTLWQFMLPNPPFIIFALVWVVSALLLAMLLYGFISRFWFQFWLLQTVLLVVACWMNTVLQASRTERYLMIALAIAGIVLGATALQQKHLKKLQEKKLSFLLIVFIALLLLAMFANVFGLFNFGKAILTSGVLGLSVGVMLLWSVRFIGSMLQDSATVFQANERGSYFDFKRLSQDAPNALYVLAGVGWLVVMTRNFYIYKKLTNPIVAFFTSTYQVGDISFSLGNAVLFITILLMAALVSRIVSFIVGQPAQSQQKEKRGRGIGSWLLLIRIGIILMGLLLAFAATGIPVDRLTIIFGGLSVGIGFGLQAIFESLVSGIILAFEKPINVGDEVQIAGQSGIMKSIGFRSSVVSTFDGSDVTIPNNELLRSQLVNWTLSNTNRRVDIVVGVDYSTDLRKISTLLEELMRNDERILKAPPPKVLVKTFGESAIDLRLLFWVNHLHPWPDVQSELMKNIKTLFDAEGVSIPFPQVVVHQQAADGAAAEADTGKKNAPDASTT